MNHPAPSPLRILAVVGSLSVAALAACGGDSPIEPDKTGGRGGTGPTGGTGGTGSAGTSGGGGSGGTAGQSGGAAGVAGAGGGGGEADHAGASGAAGSAGASPVFEPDPSCGYLDTRLIAISCSGDWNTGLKMTSTIGGEGCPDYLKIGGAVIDADGLEAIACDPSCVYVASSAALFIYCGVKGGETAFLDGGPLQTSPEGTCPALSHFDSIAGSGWYASFEEFEADNPCP